MTVPVQHFGRNRKTALACAALAAGMVAMSFAAVPLYRLFCQVTGFGGTTQRAEAVTGPVLDRLMTVRFDANVGAGLPWDFTPVDRRMDVKVGEEAQAAYRVTNRSDAATTGTATFNVSPPLAGAYFVKIECFCFTEQTLAPGQSVDMPVVFYIDPAIADDPDVANLGTVTLSYTFYPLQPPAPPALLSQADAAKREAAQQPN